MFQSTPPRGGRHSEHRPLRKLVVSIHAPARGATQQQTTREDKTTVSIHAPARGATPRSKNVSFFMLFQSTPPRGGRPYCTFFFISRNYCFNPRPRAGGDCKHHNIDFAKCVSIHAPARGATNMEVKQIYTLMFQSTPPRGGRHFKASAFNEIGLFQSTPPRGGRRWPWRCPQRVQCFNPRPRAGGDVSKCFVKVNHVVSIHAPARGATAYSESS